MGGRSLGQEGGVVPVQPCSLLQAEHHQLHGGACSGAVPEQAADPAGAALPWPERQIRFKGPACQRADCGAVTLS